ncbi:MAG: hypothetical protein D6802_12025 [Ardenticatenia bacterium]|nr:MAG: hypothetical protein D6802_12025 [Ardenticatenia bacterium]
MRAVNFHHVKPGLQGAAGGGLPGGDERLDFVHRQRMWGCPPFGEGDGAGGDDGLGTKPPRP